MIGKENFNSANVIKTCLKSALFNITYEPRYFNDPKVFIEYSNHIKNVYEIQPRKEKESINSL